MCKRDYFYSVTNDKPVIEFEQFGRTYVYWRYPYSNRFSKLKNYSEIDEINITDGDILIEKLKSNKNLYHEQKEI